MKLIGSTIVVLNSMVHFRSEAGTESLTQDGTGRVEVSYAKRRLIHGWQLSFRACRAKTCELFARFPPAVNLRLHLLAGCRVARSGLEPLEC